jgi:hypothetical protein
MRALMTALAFPAIILSGCADTSTIQSVSLSKSQFEGAVYRGESVTISSTTPGSDEYRVFHQGSSGFVSLQSVRADAEQRATEFCDRKGKAIKPLREMTSKPPYILGNFPRVELIFECVDKAASVGTPSGDDPKYTKLLNLKKLFDSGVLTQEEFGREKAKILSQP